MKGSYSSGPHDDDSWHNCDARYGNSSDYAPGDPWLDSDDMQFAASYFGTGYFGTYGMGDLASCGVDWDSTYIPPMADEAPVEMAEDPPVETADQRQWMKHSSLKNNTADWKLSRPLRVIVVMPRMLRGGAEQWLLYLSQSLRPDRVRIVRCIVSNTQITDPRFVDEMSMPVEEQRADSIARAVRECDILIVFGLPCDSLLGEHRAKLCVYVAHGDGGWTKGLLDRSRKRCDHVIAVSQRVKEAVCEGFSTTVIYNGIDSRRVAQQRPRNVVRRSFQFGDRDFVVGYLGRFSQEKRVDLLIRAVSKLPPRFKLLLVGWGHLKGRLQEMANALLPCRFAITSACDYLGDYYRAMDAFALVSNQEGFSLALLEAMMCERPVVATPVGCVPELIINRVNGVIVQPSSSEIARGLDRLASYPNWAKGLAAEGHFWAITHGHAERMARDYEALLMRLWVQKYGVDK